MTFAKFITMALEKSELSNYKLAKRLGISQTTVANWKDGSTEPRDKQRAIVLDVFGVSEDDLISGDVKIQYKKDAPAPEGERLGSRDELKAAFLEGAQDLPQKDQDELWDDAWEYYQFKLNQKRKKIKGE